VVSPDYANTQASSPTGPERTGLMLSSDEPDSRPARMTRSVPNTPSRANLSQSFDAVHPPTALDAPPEFPAIGIRSESAEDSVDNVAAAAAADPVPDVLRLDQAFDASHDTEGSSQTHAASEHDEVSKGITPGRQQQLLPGAKFYPNTMCVAPNLLLEGAHSNPMQQGYT